MALVKYGSIVTEIKGKIGGTVFQAGRSGSVAKNKQTGGGSPRHVNPQSGATQRVALKKLEDIVKRWSKITATQQLSWQALLGTYTFTNKFGDVYNGSAYQIFTSANINRNNLGLAPLDTAPVFNAAVDPMITYTDYSISGVFEETRANASAIGMMGFLSIKYPTNKGKGYKKVNTAGNIIREYLSVGTTDRKPEIQALFGGDPPLGSVIYATVWWCFPDYPKQQFFTVYEIDVVA